MEDDNWERYRMAVAAYENEIAYAAHNVFIDLATDTLVPLHLRASSHQFLAKMDMHDYAVSRHHLVWSIWLCDDMVKTAQYILEQVADMRQNAVQMLGELEAYQVLSWSLKRRDDLV